MKGQIRKTKVQNKIKLARDIMCNKKTFYKYVKQEEDQ